MSSGLFDLPAPLFDAVDSMLEYAHLPAVLRVALYACACAWIGMYLYRRYSDQPRLTLLRDDVARTQRALALHDGDFSELRVLIRHNLRLSVRQLGLTLRPALIASLPLLFVLPWLSNRFAIEPPAAGARVEACIQPPDAAPTVRWPAAADARASAAGCWTVAWPAPDSAIDLDTADGSALVALAANTKSSIVHKFTFLNWLIGNPGGYLADAAPIGSVAFGLPARELIGAGPTWMRGWEFWYFTILLIGSIGLKLRWRLS